MAAAAESAAASSRFVLYVDEEEKKRQSQKRRKQRQSQGYATKRRKVAKKPSELALEDCWEKYLRLILVATFRKIDLEWQEKSDREEALEAILCCCPPSGGIDFDKLFDSKVINILVDGDFGAIFDLARRVRDDEKIEPTLLSKAANLLHKLKDYFPENSKSLEGTPYAGHKKNFGGKALENLANEMKLVARVGHLGAKFESGLSSS